MRRLISLIVPVLLVASFSIIPPTAARSFPFGISVRGGVGAGYYSMDELQDHFDKVGRDLGLSMPSLSEGMNIMLQGRIWFFDYIAASAGYEHFWADTELEVGETSPFQYKAPTDIYTIGGAVRAFAIPTVMDINLGLNACYAKSTFGTNILTPRRLKEFKGNDWGFETYAEAATNFLYPVEVGFQIGYRRLTVKSYEDKFGDPGLFPGYNVAINIDYSGVFLYFTAGIHL